MTTYLICTLNRGQQRKHIDVCHRCDQHALCKAYQEYAQSRFEIQAQPRNDVTERPTPPAVKNEIVDQVIVELKSIQTLLRSNSSGQGKLKSGPRPDVLPEITIECLQQALKEIQADC